MKTFRLCSMTILFENPPEEGETVKGRHIPLVDGLIINKEEADKNWLLEAVTDVSLQSFFEGYRLDKTRFMAEVTITKKTNDPATVYCMIRDVFKLNDSIVVHIEGKIVAKKEDLSDMLLRTLLDEGYAGEELYNEFRKRKKDRGRSIQGVLTNAYEQARLEDEKTGEDRL
ncbi:YwpF-like family protein [Bacillus daqingensis]|uniref:YwpF-like family protein n=1 Tax=Bacillus daqingensis TaxID=872396 RepID=A0ABV9NTD0_9BACI